MWTAGTEVGRMVVAIGMDSIALIGRMERTGLVRWIMAVSAAIGSGITRTGQSAVNMTPKEGSIRAVPVTLCVVGWQSVVVQA